SRCPSLPRARAVTAVPSWLRPLVDAMPTVTGQYFSRFLPPAEGGRDSAVLVLFGEGSDGPDVLLIERASTLRAHAGQPAFPGGAQDPDDDGPVAAALREACEEVGVEEQSVTVLGTLPSLYLPPSGFVVHPVVGFWHAPHDVQVVDVGEVAAVARVPLSELVDPANRFRVGHPSGIIGPAFDVRGMVVWGFTAGLLAGILRLGGWEQPWDQDRILPLDPETLRLALRTGKRPAPPPSAQA
ncbi:MAG: hydrolase, partial [Frankiales bacterium]|nr:hydrolase [Frankiales bacterium]